MAYDKGAVSTFRQHNFSSFQNIHKPEVDNILVRPFHNTLTGIWDLAGAKKATTSSQFTWYEANRSYPLVRANTAAGAGAGAEATFLIAAGNQTAFGSYAPYNTGTTATTTAMPPRKYDTLQMLPAAGTLASAGNYINLLVTSVTGTVSFTARELDSSVAIPAIGVGSEQEIMITGNAHGEGSGLNTALSTLTTSYTENLQIVKHKYEVTGTDKLQATYMDLGGGKGKSYLPAEADSYLQFLKFQDLTLLLGKKASNVQLSDDFIDGTIDTNAPIRTTSGLIDQILTGGQILDYSNITGVTLADLWDFNTIISKDGAEFENMLYCGIDLDQQLDRELGDRVSNGSISYGTYNFNDEKALNLNFTKVKLGSFTYNKKCLEAMNDKQNTGAAGFGYSWEGFLLPMGTTKKLGHDEESGRQVPTVRKRFLANHGESRESMITYYNGFEQSSAGTDREEVRYMCEIGVEVQARSKTGYIKRA